MKIIGFLVFWLSFVNISSAFGLLKHLSEKIHPESKPPGILDTLKKPKLPVVNIYLSKAKEGFGAGASIGTFRFGFGFGGHYVPPKVPGVESQLPDGWKPDYPVPDGWKPDYPVPDLKPDYPVPSLKPDYPVPDLKPDYPVPDLKPVYPVPDLTHHDPKRPGATWGKGEKEGWSRPNWEEHEQGKPKGGSYGEGGVEYPKRIDSYEEEIKEHDARPDWEDIGEKIPDSKSEDFMEGELVDGGLIQPRLNKRNRRYIESHVYHVPLLFRSNAKPFRVKIQSHPNSLVKAEK